MSGELTSILLKVVHEFPLSEQVAALGRLFKTSSPSYAGFVLKAMESVATELCETDPSGIDEILEQSEESDVPTAWFRACLFAHQKRYSSAAGCLDGVFDPLVGDSRSMVGVAAAKYYAKADETETAKWFLVEAIKSAESLSSLTSADKVAARLKKTISHFKRSVKIALLGTMTTDFWIPAISSLCFSEGIDAQFYTSFNQYAQEILDPESSLRRFAPDFVILAVDWRSIGLANHKGDQRPDAVVRELKNLWTRCTEDLGAKVIQLNFEVPAIDPLGYLSNVLENGIARAIRAINSQLIASQHEMTGVTVLDMDYVSSLHGKNRWEETALWYSSRQYPSLSGIPTLASHLVALIRASLGLSKKCMVVDLDGTLWGGTIGEDGVDGIRLGGTGAGEAYLDIQRYLLALKERGIILAVCSKNEERDAKLPFETHPEMLLKVDDFSVFAANWDAKDSNIRYIAQELNIGIDSLVFMDDNPIERALMRRRCPEVAVPELSDDPAEFLRELDRGRYFEAVGFTEEDRIRSQAYNNRLRQPTIPHSANVTEYLKQLKIKIELTPFNERNLPRIAQLVQKTNQFNLTTRRMSDVQLRALIGREDCYSQAVRVSDAFGDNGLTGAMIAFHEGHAIRIHMWLLSCRVLGRRIEDAMFSCLFKYARNKGCRHIVGEYIPTAKNNQVSDLYKRFNFELVESSSLGQSFALDVSNADFYCPEFLGISDMTQV